MRNPLFFAVKLYPDGRPLEALPQTTLRAAVGLTAGAKKSSAAKAKKKARQELRLK
jgi:hypothetical protein